MTAEQFNALPLAARRFIEANAGCLGCGGNKEQKLTKAYELYLTRKKMGTFQLFGGGVNYVQGDEKGVLYHINSEDSDFEIRHKIKIAKLIHESNPELFMSFDENGMQELIEGLAPEKVVNLDAPPAVDAPKRGKGGQFQKKDVLDEI